MLKNFYVLELNCSWHLKHITSVKACYRAFKMPHNQGLISTLGARGTSGLGPTKYSTNFIIVIAFYKESLLATFTNIDWQAVKSIESAECPVITPDPTAPDTCTIVKAPSDTPKLAKKEHWKGNWVTRCKQGLSPGGQICKQKMILMRILQEASQRNHGCRFWKSSQGRN